MQTNTAVSLDNTPNQHLHPDVRTRVLNLDEQTCREWGGEWLDGTPSVSPSPVPADHETRTVVRSSEDGVDAFEKYTEWFQYILDEYEPTHSSVVLVPCGASKPIGSSQIHQKKLNALEQADYLRDSDLMIMSEPCTIIPHSERLCLPAVNYDFPPEYAEESHSPAVFEVFTDRLATWIDEFGYDVIYSYLVKRHQNKLDAALEKADSSPTVVSVSGASANISKLESEGDAAFSGDLFKSVEDIEAKLRFTRYYCDPSVTGDCGVGVYSDSVTDFYRDRFTN